MANTYTYDTVGNRLTGPTATDAATYNNGHLLTLSGTINYTYDANGNQLTRDGWTQQWDAQNRLIQLQTSDGDNSTTITFSYDPFNRRIQKQCATILNEETTTTTTQYVYDGEDIVLQLQTIEYNDSTTTTTETRFIHGPGIDEPLAMVEDGDTYFYHADGLGSIVAMTDDALNIVQHYSYDSFGTPTLSDPDFIQPYTFTGREWDDETELYFYRARYYDPSAGRFISEDPIGFNGGDANLYGYAGNDPVNWGDSYGLARIRGITDKPIYVTGGDPDPFPSDPHGHIGHPESSLKVDVNTGEIYKGTQLTGSKLTKKQLAKLRDVLIRKGYNLGMIALAPGLLEDLNTLLRAQENSKSFADQVKEDVQKLGPYLDTPIGIMPNPYYDPCGFEQL